MIVTSVFRRPQRHVSPEEPGEIFLRAGVGIDGDCHANPLSPRQVLLVSAGTYEFCAVAPGSLRENMLVGVDELRLSSGSCLRVGPDAVLRISFQCEPCGRLNLVRPNLARDIRDRRGYLARVVRDGLVKPGDQIHVEPDVFRPFPDYWKDRVIGILHLLPENCLISYGRLAELAGVPKSFCRSFPRLLRSQPDIPWQRVVPLDHVSTTPQARKFRVWLGSAIFEDESSFHEGAMI